MLMAYSACNCAAVTPVSNDAAAPPTDQDACVPSGGGGGFGGGSCQNTSTETCGGVNYQVNCSCPEGSCVCFGPTTHVVSYPGCPYCPGVGAPISDVFSLCGFPP